jgi:cytochrome c553
LRAAPPDLGTLAARNNGTFPRQRVKGAILNVERPVAAHATGEMPVWAHVFSALDPDAGRLERRLDALVGFIETLQQPVVPTVDLGRALYAAHCATCHGSTGQGAAAPDLTRHAMGNGGVFPSQRLAQVIDGRSVAAHGPRGMPVWGDAFRSVPGDSSPAAAAARVEAITRFLASIQLHASH